MNQISRRQFLRAGSAFAGAFALSACGGSSSDTSADTTTTTDADAGSYTLVEEGKLTVVSNLYFPPFESMDEKTGEAVGFDVDVSKAVAEHMGLEAEWLPNQAFDALVPTIKAGGTADVAIAGMTITDEREQEVDMSEPYVDSNQAFVTKAGSTETTESANSADKKVAVQAGTTGEEWVLENLPEATCVPLDDIIAAMTGLQTGYYDAIVVDLPVASYQIKNSFSDLQVVEPIPTGEQYGMAVSKDNPGLTEAINAALAQMAEDGTMAQIQTEWFGSEL